MSYTDRPLLGLPDYADCPFIVRAEDDDDGDDEDDDEGVWGDKRDDAEGPEGGNDGRGLLLVLLLVSV